MSKLLGIKQFCEFWQTVKGLLDKKVDKVSGKGLSANDFTNADKTKLDGIEAGAQVNQNAFSNVKVGSTTIEADTKTDTLELEAGDNITLTPDATNDKVKIAAKDTTYTPASASPKMDGTAAVGTSAKYAREDHVHPTDTSRAASSHTHSDYVKKTGDTMSGNLTINKADGTLGLKSSNLTGKVGETVPSSNTSFGSFKTFDQTGETVFYSQTFKTTADQTYTSFITKRLNAADTAIYHGFYVRINADGTLTVTFPSTASRDAWATGMNVVKKAGDTMSGLLSILMASGDVYFKAKRTDTGVECDFGVGAGGTNHGVYSPKLSRWLVNGNASDVFLAGVNYTSQTQNKVLASPDGSTGAAGFRALVAADIPNLNASKITAGTLPAARGGTGKTYGLNWQSIASTTGTTKKTFSSVAGYSEVLIVCTFPNTSNSSISKYFSTVIPHAAVGTVTLEVWVGGGRGTSTAGYPNSGARAVCDFTQTSIQGVSATDGATDRTSAATWYVYAR